MKALFASWFSLALWKRVPYRPWRFLHQAMPVLYLALAFHAVMWAPTGYWTGPLGMLLAVLVGADSPPVLTATTR